MLQIEIKSCFIELGKFLSQFSLNINQQKIGVKNNEEYFDAFADLILLSQSHNGWFTPEQVHHSIASWTEALTEENLNKWLANYTITEESNKNIGIILAGNIPLVGFHDFYLF